MAEVKDGEVDDRSHPRDGVEDSPSSLSVSCSICLELVADDSTRSRAKLQCGHQFHLDCIGSAFNTKGAMQCPNCRKVEKGQWLYANGSSRAYPEFAMEDLTPEEDLYALSYPEMHYGVHWCPFGELSHAASFEELESPTTTYYEYHGHHTMYAEHTATSSYLAYVGPVPTTAPITRDNGEDHHLWSNHSGQNDSFNRLIIAPPYLGWDPLHHSPSFPLPNAHIIAPSEIDASAHPRSYPHPFLFGYRSSPRTAGPTIHHHPGSHTLTRDQAHVSHLFNHHQQQQHGNALNLTSHLIPLTRRGMLQPQPQLLNPRPPNQRSGYFAFPPPSLLTSLHEPETDHLQAWERDSSPHLPVSSRDSTRGSSNHRAASSFWHRHHLS